MDQDVDDTLAQPIPLPVRRKPIIPNGVLGMVVFILTEIMFFAGLISAFMIVKAGAPGGVWPPPGQPRLPIEETAFNTGALLLSGVLLFIASKVFDRDEAKAKWPMLASILLGVFFVVAQGMEWVVLLGEGNFVVNLLDPEKAFSLNSSTHGSFFYLIVGTHGLHAVIAICFLVGQFVQLLLGKLHRTSLSTAAVFWYFVVLLWPILYINVYL